MITVSIDFVDGYNRYFAGESVDERSFEPDDLARFLEYGWVSDGVERNPTVTQAAELVVHDSIISPTSEI